MSMAPGLRPGATLYGEAGKISGKQPKGKTMNITSKEKAFEIARHFEEIKARGGHAAIDFYNGELVLQCTRPNWQRPETWGRGAAPQTMDARWVRLTVC